MRCWIWCSMPSPLSRTARRTRPFSRPAVTTIWVRRRMGERVVDQDAHDLRHPDRIALGLDPAVPAGAARAGVVLSQSGLELPGDRARELTQVTPRGAARANLTPALTGRAVPGQLPGAGPDPAPGPGIVSGSRRRGLVLEQLHEAPSEKTGVRSSCEAVAMTSCGPARAARAAVHLVEGDRQLPSSSAESTGSGGQTLRRRPAWRPARGVDALAQAAAGR